VALSLLLILLVAGVGFAATRSASNRAQAVHIADRAQEQGTLAGLGTQYVLFGFKEEINYSSTHSWSLRPADPGDVAELKEYATQSALLGYGAALVDLTTGAYISSTAPATGLPPVGDPGMAPLLTSLRHGSPGLSSVMHVGSVPLVAYGISLTTQGTTVGFLGFSRLDQSPLESYVTHLRFGSTGVSYVLDSNGVAVAASNPALVGRPLATIPPLAALKKGKGGFTQYRSAKGLQVASFDPIELGGWGALTTQSASEFFGPIHSGIEGVEEALALLLVVVAAVIALFIRRRHVALRREMRTMKELAEGRERFRHAFEETPVGMALIDVQPESRGKFLQVNKALCQLTGFSVTEMLEHRFNDLVHPDNAEEVHSSSEGLFSGDSSFELEIRVATKTGDWKWALLHGSLIRDASSCPLYGVAHVEDISGRKLAEDRLAHQALHDALTGLPNRALIVDRAEQMFARARRERLQVGALFLDLDNFKAINDGLGHPAGDHLLKAVAARVSSVLRASDTVGRFGGDEFVVLVEADSLDAGPELVADRLIEILREPFALAELAGGPLTITASIGVALGARASAEEMLRDADVALYEAKAAGKNCSRVFRSEMQHAVSDRLELEMDLRNALENQQLFVVYQPIFDLQNEEIAAVEALLRWQHPTRGVVSPDTFIPIAEDTGLIVPLGRWVLAEACEQAQRWHQLGRPLGMSVNVSARQIARDDLVDHVREALAVSGLEPGFLTLEITETTLMRDADATIRRLRTLKELGVRIAIDDFGTGYSSLAYLRQFPVDALKIDRSFIAGIASSNESAALIHTLIQLGKTLDLETLAEGIEEPAQLQRLQREHCDTGQGFLFARPLDVAAVEQFLEIDHTDRTGRRMKGART